MIPGIPWLRLLGGLLGLIALASAGWLIKDRFHQKALAEDARGCAAAAAAPGDDLPLTRCLAAVMTEIIEARRARLCETTLLPQLRPETRFAMQQSCGAGTKRLVAVSDVLAQDRASLTAQLAGQQTSSIRAVERAERRSTKIHERDQDGRQAIDAAPRSADGRILCDAGCLQRLAE